MTSPPATTAAPREIVVDGVSKSYGDHAVLRDVDLTIDRGEIVAIVGMSGSGKTVLMDIMVGLRKPDTGRVLVADHALAGAPLRDLDALGPDDLDDLRRHWAVVFQHNALFGGTVRDNCALWLRENTDLGAAQIERRIRAALQAAALDVDDVIDKDRDELSGGMAKRVAVARAIAMDPKIIFYDEPTTGLDPIVAGAVHELVWETHSGRRDGGTPRTTVIVTHDRELLRRLAPRIVMLHDTGVCFDGAYEDFGGPGCDIAREYLAAMPVLHAREPG